MKVVTVYIKGGLIPKTPPGASIKPIPLPLDIGELIVPLVSSKEADRIASMLFPIDTTFRDMILNECPKKRIAHLARYARKKRTRKKNYRRACKYFEGV